ncbi:tetratricopeptide repeat-containing protein [Calothrix sp. NIES-2100]|nr:tetratricopeptide repeat-containing protein [Calothrix sp. NIES-2100]
MRLAGGLTAVLFAATIVIVQPVATALTPAEVYSIAQKITVRIDGANTGSGIIIERTGDTYTVVTNWHVMRLEGSYTVRTEDGRQYNINHNQVKPLGNVDLAVFQFTSNQNYPVADKGNSDQLTGGKTVYVAGYPTGISGVSGRNFKFLSGQISSLLSNPKDGYALDYTVQSFKGMSGGPILDEQGKLVGIHGRAGTDPIAGGTAVLGIPLKTYLTLAPSAKPTTIAVGNIPGNKPISTTSSVLSNAQAYVQQALERWDNGDKQKAIEDLKQAQQLDPDKAEKAGLSLAQEAAQAAQSQKFDLALPRAQIASYLAPKNDKVWFLLGGIYLQTKNFDEAIAALTKAQSLNPKNADVLFAIGSANFQQEKYQPAIVNYQAGLKLKPNDPEGLFDLGNAYYKLGRFSDAIAQYNKAISQDQKFWAAVNNIGLIKYEQGDIQGAIQQWQTAVSLDKQAPEPLLALAVALYTKGDRQQGLAMGQAALRINKRYGDLDFLKQNLWGDRLLADTKKLLQYLQSR